MQQVPLLDSQQEDQPVDEAQQLVEVILGRQGAGM